MTTQITPSLEENLTTIKELLPAEDILLFNFHTKDKIPCAIVYADGMVNKQLLGDLVARPIGKLQLYQKNDGGMSEFNKNGRTMYEFKKNEPTMYEMKVNGGGSYAVNGFIERVKTALLFPELKEEKNFSKLTEEILDGWSRYQSN